MSKSKLFNLTAALALLALVGYVGFWQWGICRVYVPEGHSLLVRYKGNLVWQSPRMAEGDFARTDEDGRPLEVGVFEQMMGPGRHFQFDPIHFERIVVEDIVIEPGHVGVVTSKLGKDLPPGEFLVDGDIGQTEYKGVVRKVLKPGRYRVNPYGYTVRVFGPGAKVVKVYGMPDEKRKRPEAPQAPTGDLTGKKSGWVRIPAGYVGVVTNLAADPLRGLAAGIQDKVLQPGIYAVNPHERQVDVVEIGYRGITIKADLAKDAQGELVLDEHGEPTPATGGSKGINFPSSDGFPISLDFTSIWGIMPEHAPKVVTLFGNVGEVEHTVIGPEIESTCRIHGSKLGAVELLIGDSREAFQKDVSGDFRDVLSAKNISLRVGLVRHIYIPAEVRGPIQKANIADELKLTRDIEIETAKVEADLEEAKATVKLEEKRVVAETEKLYQSALAKGHKTVEEIRADTERMVAAIEKDTAAVEAEAVRLLGEAEADADKLRREAEAQKLELAVKAFGAPDAYNQWVFATGLPEELKLKLIYAGQGTFWTDLDDFEHAAAAKILEKSSRQDLDVRTAGAHP